jgi:MFS family permease
VDEGFVQRWMGIITALFLVGAALGGLVFGWLGDRVGRVRAMTWSILFYSGFTGLCYFATEPWHLGALRFIAALGMGGEWALGVALVMESWPGAKRPLLAGDRRGGERRLCSHHDHRHRLPHRRPRGVG